MIGEAICGYPCFGLTIISPDIPMQKELMYSAQTD